MAPFPPPDYRCELPGLTVHYTQAGTGQPLLLIHGSLCDYRYWRWQLPALGEQYRVIAPSLRGYWPQAYTQADPLFSISRHAQDMEAFIATLEQPVHVLGHSRGAQVALDLALRAPGLVRSLTLADPGFRLAGEADRPLFHGEMAARLSRGETSEALAGFVDHANGAGTWRQMTSWFKTMVADNGATLLSQAQEAHVPVDPEQLRRLPCPLLLLGGAQSPERYVSRLDALEAAVPSAVRKTIPLAAHGMNLANPKAFNQAVAAFLADAGRDMAARR